jgi:hypothetical protein
MVIANLIILPTMPILILILKVLVFPKFLEITEIYDQPSAGDQLLLVMQIRFLGGGAQLLLAFFLWCWVFFYVRGPRDYGWVRVDGAKPLAAPFRIRRCGSSPAAVLV